MNRNPSANRCLRDQAIDHIDHALGRPAFPLRESYRNYFATEADGELARTFAASPLWELRNTAGRMAYFSVTEAGRRTVAAYLSALKLDSVYVVQFEGHERIVPAATASKARYSYYLSIRDCLADVPFMAFLRRTTVRKAA